MHKLSATRLSHTVLRTWEQDDWAGAEQCWKLAPIILAELLAYQFVSPVQWIQMQDQLFSEFAFERFIEVGL